MAKKPIKAAPVAKDTFRIDRQFDRPVWRVYYWAKRSNAENYIESAQYTWHPDSEHNSLAAAEARLKELQAGAAKRSLQLPVKRG